MSGGDPKNKDETAFALTFGGIAVLVVVMLVMAMTQGS